MPEWRSPKRLVDHFEKHGQRMGLDNIDAYDASARATIARGTIFGYEDEETGEWRVGYYDREAGLFTAVSDDDRYIVTHYPSDEDYVLDLTDSTYGDQP